MHLLTYLTDLSQWL